MSSAKRGIATPLDVFTAARLELARAVMSIAVHLARRLMPVHIAQDFTEAIETDLALSGNGLELTVWVHRCTARGRSLRMLPTAFDRCSSCGERSPATQIEIDALTVAALRKEG